MDKSELDKLGVMNEETELIVQDGLPSALEVVEVKKELLVNAKITYSKDRPFKCEPGNTGTNILYEGVFNGTIPVVLKEYQNDKEKLVKAKRDLETLSSKDNIHPNFIRYFGHVEDTDANLTYIVIELCECSVADIIDPKKKEVAREKMPYFTDILMNLSHKEILKQSSEAICFLHGRNKIHRNLHPENFLIACVDPINKDHFLVKLTDFQFTKDITKQPKNTRPNTKDGWVAPESCSTKDDVLTIKFDSFLLGCYYFYVLSGGFHPFGERLTSQRTRIGCDQDPVYKEEWDGGPNWPTRTTPFRHELAFYQEETGWALAMIKDLIKYKAMDRKSVEEILESKYFLPESYVIYGNPTNNGPPAEKPGLCVILTQEMYYNPMGDLDYLEDYSAKERYEGVELDGKKLVETFKNFGYDILRFRNLQAKEIETFLSSEELVKRTKVSFKNYASLVVCILGHGDKGVVCGVDGKPVSLNRIQYDAFDEQGCPDLKGKPKIFIVLACQGNREQQVILAEQQNDGNNYSNLSGRVRFKRSTTYEDQAPPVYDFIRLSSTIEEYECQMHYGTGSVFIQSLCKALQNEYKDPNPGKKERYKRDLTQLFTTFVTPNVAFSGSTFKQTPEFRSSLSKMIRFRQCTTSADSRDNSSSQGVDDKLESHGLGVVFEPQLEDNGANSDAFKIGRSSYEKQGFKKKKIISRDDYESLLSAIVLVVEAGGQEAANNVEVYQAIAWVIRNRYYLKLHKSLTESCKELINIMQLVGSQSDCITKDRVKNSITNQIYKKMNYEDPTFGAAYFIIQNYKGQQLTMPENYEMTCKIGYYEFYKESPQVRRRWTNFFNCNIS